METGINTFSTSSFEILLRSTNLDGRLMSVGHLHVSLLARVLPVRVTEEEEIEGLDIGEHGQEAYPDFSPRSH